MHTLFMYVLGKFEKLHAKLIFGNRVAKYS
jgi:hypothetical protein